MAKLKFKNPKTGLWEEVSGSLQNLKDGEKASLYMDNTNEVTTPAGGTTLHPDPTSSTAAPISTGTGSFAIGSGTKATGDVSVAEGILNEASGKAAHAEGTGTKAGGNTSHSEGFYTETIGDYSHAENYGTIAQGKKSHAEGGQTKAIGEASHAEGIGTTASGYNSHSEGGITTASGMHSHAEGYGTIADGKASHAGGFVNETHADFSTVIGMYGEVIPKNDNRLFVVGNGTSETSRSNAFEVYADGTGYLNKKKILVEGDAGGGGDVTAAGDNTFTGTNTFKNESNFEGKVNIDDGIILIPKNVDTENTLSISVDANEGTIAAVRTLATGGTAPKDISFVGSVLKNIGTPIADTDAATKKYVDDHAIGNVTASATSIDSSEPATATATTSGNDISFAFGIPKGAKGDPGNDYVLTDADKSEIAALVLAQIPNGDEVAYG